MGNIYEKKYAKFMEQTLQEMVQMPVEGICMVIKLADGCVATQYYNTNMMDKLLFAGILQQEAILDTLKANNAIGEEDSSAGE